MPEEYIFEDPLKKLAKDIEHTAEETAGLYYAHLSHLLDGLSHQASQAQRLFLQTRSLSLQQIHELLQMQVSTAGRRLASLGVPSLPALPSLPDLAALIRPGSRAEEPPAAAPAPSVAPAPERTPALFSRAQLDEFATGSMAACFGPEFAIFEGRRTPRIPNGDFLLMSRVLSITGRRMDFKSGAEVVTELDVPADAWFIAGNPSTYTPYGILMEIALQPCGVLSAYLGTSLIDPQQEYFFRNLDGHADLIAAPDLRGQTLRASARLLSSLASGGTIIQKYAFELVCQGAPFFRGESVFGYFTPEAMANQVGLDGGRERPPEIASTALGGTAGTWVDLADATTAARYRQPGGSLRLASGRLDFIRKVYIEAGGGRHAKGYLYAEKDVDPADWFFARHFYQDAVMPGSLGVEAVLEALQVYAIHAGLGARFNAPRFAPVEGGAMQWKYRGQIVPRNRSMKLEIHLTSVDEHSGRVVVRGDASVWADGIRIYEIRQAAISIHEG